MRLRQVMNCCTAKEIDQFVFDQYAQLPTFKAIYQQEKQTLQNIIQSELKSNTKIIHAYITDKQPYAAKELRKVGFKRAGRKNTRTDRHNTTLQLYYYIFE